LNYSILVDFVLPDLEVDRRTSHASRYYCDIQGSYSVLAFN